MGGTRASIRHSFMLIARGCSHPLRPGRVPGVPVDLDALLEPWFQAVMDEAGRPALFDAHTHFGQNDPDTFRQTAEELLAELAGIDARALVFPMHEPDGYTAANQAVLEAAAASGGRLTALCRVSPHARGCARRGAALHGRGRRGDQAAPARRGVRHGGARRARPHGARPRAPRRGPHARRPRDPGARREHDRLLRGVPRRAADPRPLRDLRPRLARARAAVASERLHRHVVVAPGRHPRRLLPRRRPARSCGPATRPTGGRWPARCSRCAARWRPG